MRHRWKLRDLRFGMTSLFGLLSLVIAGGAEPQADGGKKSNLAATETVLITYHVIPGKEKVLQQLLGNVWDIYAKEHLVLAGPHVVVCEKEAGDKKRFVEIFTWVNSDAPDHSPDAVKRLWDEMQACCEKRNGHAGLEGGPVELLVPSSR